jgi:hypothetical protein
MVKHRGPAWWLLYALVPLLAGLCVVEPRAPLPPGWHRGVQVGIVLVIYGLVWLWLRANALRLLCSNQGMVTRERTFAACRAAIHSPGARFTPRRAYVSHMRARHCYRGVSLQVKGRRMRKCSRNFDRQSS